MKKDMLKEFIFALIFFLIIVPFKVKALSYVNLTPGAAFDYFSDLQEPYHTGSNMPEPYYRIKSNNDTYYAQFLQKNDTYISEKSGFTYGNVSLCDGEPVLLVNYFYINSNTDFYKNAHVYLSQDNKLSLCSTTFDESNGLLEYKCNTNYLKNSTFEIYMTNLDYSLFASYNVENQIYTYKSFQVTCNPSTSSVIDNQNQNKNDIINNQNQNKEDIMNSISGATGSVIGNQNQNTQDIINNQNQNNQQIIENNNQNFDDLNQNIKDQFNECHMEGGKNLFHGSKTITQNGFTTVIDGSHIKFSGTRADSSRDTWLFGANTLFLELDEGTYTVSFKSDTDLSNFNLYLYDKKNGSLNNFLTVFLPSSKTFTLSEKTTVYFSFVLSFRNSVSSFNNVDVGVQIEKGSSATSFEEYGEEHEVCSNKMDTTNNKLDEAEETRKGIWGTIKELLSTIINLPGKLVGLLIDALKSLFVPTNDQLQEIINDSKDLTENFGFIGESMAFFINIFTSLLGMVNAEGCVLLPEFTIGQTSLFEAHTFWESQNVCLADNVVLSSNIETIRTITSIVLVCLFISFAASRFFDMLSKNESGTTYDVGTDGDVTSAVKVTHLNGNTIRERQF